MSAAEFLPRTPEQEAKPEVLDLGAILDRLFALQEECGFDLERDTLADLIGENDTETLENLASFACEYGFEDPDELFKQLGIPASTSDEAFRHEIDE